MNNILSKFYLLNKKNRKEVMAFLESLLDNERKNESNLTEYKKKILSVSTWTEDEINELVSNQKYINQWKAENW